MLFKGFRDHGVGEHRENTAGCDGGNERNPPARGILQGGVADYGQTPAPPVPRNPVGSFGLPTVMKAWCVGRPQHPSP